MVVNGREVTQVAEVKMFDDDKYGIEKGEKISIESGFMRLELPPYGVRLIEFVKQK